jgi:hypothetical protein
LAEPFVAKALPIESATAELQPVANAIAAASTTITAAATRYRLDR